MDFNLDNRIAFIAGASSGLGFAAAESLAREGCKVALCSRNQKRIEQAAEEIRRAVNGPTENILPLECDVTDESAIEAAIAKAVDHFGGLNILLTNAGGPPAGAISDFNASDWRDAIELNLMSTINLTRHARPHLERAAREDDHARILMVSSVSAKQPLKALPLSNTSRAGVQGYAKSLANELGPLGVTVNTLLPGYTKTERLNELAEARASDSGETIEQIEEEWAQQNALKRLGTPEEFAATVTFLASEPAGYITGVALPVDGGRSKHLL